MRVAAASQLIANAVTSCCCWTFTFITVILAVAAIAGADYSAYVIFIPQFVIAGLLVCCMTCIICCVRGLPEDDLGGRRHWLILFFPGECLLIPRVTHVLGAQQINKLGGFEEHSIRYQLSKRVSGYTN